ncbi:MAG: hypothetical protein ACKO37_06245, partial [Vampirovibrionales bacterium]
MTAFPVNPLLQAYRHGVSQYRQAAAANDTPLAQEGLQQTQRSLQALMNALTQDFPGLPAYEVTPTSLMRMTDAGTLTFDPSHRYGALTKAMNRDVNLVRQLFLRTPEGKRHAQSVLAQQ